MHLRAKKTINRFYPRKRELREQVGKTCQLLISLHVWLLGFSTFPSDWFLFMTSFVRSQRDDVIFEQVVCVRRGCSSRLFWFERKWRHRRFRLNLNLRHTLFTHLLIRNSLRQRRRPMIRRKHADVIDPSTNHDAAADILKRGGKNVITSKENEKKINKKILQLTLDVTSCSCESYEKQTGKIN